MKVYIVVKLDYDTGYSIFCEIFFKRELAEDWIQIRVKPEDYSIETYKEQKDGSAIEVH
jgi:hypothetical protein